MTPYFIRFANLKGLENAYIGLQIEQDTKERVYVKFDSTGKLISTVNNQKETKKNAQKRNIDYICADALHIFQKDPQFRRRILDRFCSKYDSVYEEKIKIYDKLLRQKNKYLKQESPDDFYVQTLNKQLVVLANIIVQKRMQCLDLIQNKLNEKSDLKEKLGIQDVSIDYSCTRLEFNKDDDYEEILLQKLEEDRQKEKILGYSLAGPQRDDFDIILGEKSIFSNYSRGINRCYAILFRLAQIDLLISPSTSQCLLLDDTFAEIDQKNKELLVTDIRKKYQVFYATTSTNDVSFFQDAQLINISQGEIAYV